VAAAADGVTVTIGAAAGRYTGQPAGRRYLIRVHRSGPPASVTVDDAVLGRHPSKEGFDSSRPGWYHDPERGGVTVVATPPIAAEATATVTLR
jgi:hypothetical protein